MIDTNVNINMVDIFLSFMQHVEQMKKDSIVIVGRNNSFPELRTSWEEKGIEVTLIKDVHEAKKKIGKTPCSLVGLDTETFNTFVSQSSPTTVSLKDYIEKRLHDFIKRFKSSEGSNLYYTLLREIEKPLITMVLKETKGNQLEAAHTLGLNRNTLRKKIKELNISLDKIK